MRTGQQKKEKKEKRVNIEGNERKSLGNMRKDGKKSMRDNFDDEKKHLKK